MLYIEVNMFKHSGSLEGLCSPVLIVKKTKESDERVVIPLPERMKVEQGEEVVRTIKKALEGKTLDEVRELIYGGTTEEE